jgi:hypothetical protein
MFEQINVLITALEWKQIMTFKIIFFQLQKSSFKQQKARSLPRLRASDEAS